jgi:hypothetical protein
MQRTMDPVSIVQRAGQFTVDWLREVIRFLAGRYKVPSDYELARLAALLNGIDAAYKNSTNLALAIEARHAVWVLGRFFDVGKPVYEEGEIAPSYETDPRIANLVREMEAHAHAMGMTAGGMMRPYESFRDFDHFIAHGFQMALRTSNPGKKIGLFTNTGPIARLTNEAIGAITGKKPGAYNVGQHLKQPDRKKRS